jgi:hypothetical protein
MVDVLLEIIRKDMPIRRCFSPAIAASSFTQALLRICLRFELSRYLIIAVSGWATGSPLFSAFDLKTLEETGNKEKLVSSSSEASYWQLVTGS